jgi:hypothetical protein
MGHVNKTHPLKGKKLVIMGSNKFTIRHQANCASFANKGSPFSDVGKGKASFLLAVTNEWSPDRETLGMISRVTRSGLVTTGKWEAGIREVTAQDAAVIG